MYYTNVKGFSIAYRRAGNGPALILLHGGLNCNSRMWKPQIENLSDSLTIIAWNAPGTGKSDETPEQFTIYDWAACLAGLLDTIGIKQALMFAFFIITGANVAAKTGFEGPCQRIFLVMFVTWIILTTLQLRSTIAKQYGRRTNI